MPKLIKLSNKFLKRNTVGFAGHCVTCRVCESELEITHRELVLEKSKSQEALNHYRERIKGLGYEIESRNAYTATESDNPLHEYQLYSTNFDRERHSELKQMHYAWYCGECLSQNLFILEEINYGGNIKALVELIKNQTRLNITMKDVECSEKCGIDDVSTTCDDIETEISNVHGELEDISQALNTLDGKITEMLNEKSKADTSSCRYNPY